MILSSKWTNLYKHWIWYSEKRWVYDPLVKKTFDTMTLCHFTAFNSSMDAHYSLTLFTVVLSTSVVIGVARFPSHNLKCSFILITASIFLVILTLKKALGSLNMLKPSFFLHAFEQFNVTNVSTSLLWNKIPFFTSP